MCIWCRKEEKPNETTTVTAIVTDQGNGGPHCDTCGHTEHMVVWVDRCPNCRRRIVGNSVWINQGGSDY